MTYSFTDRQEETKLDVFNIVGDNHVTIRKQIDRDDKITALANIHSIIESNVRQLCTMEESDYNEKFFHGFHTCETIYFEAIHNFLSETFGVSNEEIDCIFRIKDGKPFVDIEVEGISFRDDGDDDSDDDPDPKDPTPPSHPEVKKIKEDLEQ
jgi:hypothetical protein